MKPARAARQVRRRRRRKKGLLWRVQAALLASLVLLAGLLLGACTAPTTQPATPPQLAPLAGAPAPELPFADNPDPAQCGIPIRWGQDDPAWLTGFYGGELVEPLVHLYDGHLRNGVTGLAPHGSRVQIILYQQNPQLDYYLVKTLDLDPPQEGWTPAPFLSFEPVEPAP